MGYQKYRQKTEWEMREDTTDDFCLVGEVEIPNGRQSIWSVVMDDSLIISRGVLKKGKSEVRFDILLDKSCGVNVMWESYKGGTSIGEHIFMFDSLSKPGTYWVDLNADKKGAGIFDRVLMDQGVINGHGDGLLVKFLDEADEWIEKQDFYKEAIIYSSGWRLFYAEEERKIAQDSLDEVVKTGGHGVLLKHPSREMRELVIRNIGRKRGGR